jgi:hypothetical protein
MTGTCALATQFNVMYLFYSHCVSQCDRFRKARPTLQGTRGVIRRPPHEGEPSVLLCSPSHCFCRISRQHQCVSACIQRVKLFRTEHQRFCIRYCYHYHDHHLFNHKHDGSNHNYNCYLRLLLTTVWLQVDQSYYREGDLPSFISWILVSQTPEAIWQQQLIVRGTVSLAICITHRG